MCGYFGCCLAVLCCGFELALVAIWLLCICFLLQVCLFVVWLDLLLDGYGWFGVAAFGFRLQIVILPLIVAPIVLVVGLKQFVQGALFRLVGVCSTVRWCLISSALRAVGFCCWLFVLL